MVINGDNIRKIHKEIYKITLQMPKMYLFMSKVANKSHKYINIKNSKSENADLLLVLFKNLDYNGKIKKIINKTVTDEAEKGKENLIKNYIEDSRDDGKWIYLASSHNDCAKDHIPYQGKLYYDEKAPENIVKWCKKNGYHSIQWVMGEPAWFITRPNCRHYFKSLNFNIVNKYGVKELQRRYKTHRKEGDRDLSTPRKVAIEEYTDRLKLLRALYEKHKTEKLRREIDKTELLLKKWKKLI